MNRHAALRLALLLCATGLAGPAAGQQLPVSPTARRPCPALIARIDGWIVDLGGPLTEPQRRKLQRRLESAGPAAVVRMAAALGPSYAAYQKALLARKPQARHLLGRVLDLIQLLGQSGSPHAYPPLARAAGDRGWTTTLRKRVVAAIGRLSDPRALPLLQGMLQDQELGYTAGRAILDTRRFESVTHWIDLLDSQSADLKVDAHEALKKWSGEQMGPDRKAWRRFFTQYPEGFKKLPGYKEPD